MVISVVAILIVAAVLIFDRTNSGRNNHWKGCGAQESSPGRDLSKLINIYSSDLNALVNFAGYIQFESHYEPKLGKDLILPIPLERVDLLANIAQGGDQLDLTSGCAKISLLLTYENNRTMMNCDRISVAIKRNGRFEQICSVAPSSISLGVDQHFSCPTTTSFPCQVSFRDRESRHHYKTVALLVLEMLEFEIGGNRTDHRERQFSKPSRSC